MKKIIITCIAVLGTALVAGAQVKEKPAKTETVTEPVRKEEKKEAQPQVKKDSKQTGEVVPVKRQEAAPATPPKQEEKKPMAPKRNMVDPVKKKNLKEKQMKSPKNG